MEDFLASVLPRPAGKGVGFGDNYPQIIMYLQNFVALNKISIKHTTKQISFPLKIYLAPPNLKNWLKA